MGFFQQLMTSPRQQQAKSIYDTAMRDAGDLLNGIDNLHSATEGINSIGDVRNTFGIGSFDKAGYEKGVAKSFDPARARLSTRMAQARKAVAARNNGALGQPELNFSPVEQNYADAFASLEGNQAQAELAGFDKEQENNKSVASIMQQILSGRDSFALGKFGMKQNAMGMKQNGMAQYLSSLSDSTGLDDILSGGLFAAQAAGALGWNPFKAKVKPGGGAQYAGSAMFLPPE